MKKIIIDARELRTSSGRYVERLLSYLQGIDKENSYFVLLKPADMDGWQPKAPNFQKVACPHKEFTFDEQTGFKKQLDQLGADLVHFIMVQQPIRYRGKTVTTMNDLTTLRFDNPAKNRIIFRFKQRVYALVNHYAARKARLIMTFTHYVKDDIVDYTGVDPDKVVVVPLAANIITEPAETLSYLEGKQFLMYVGRPTPHKNLERLIEAFSSLRASRPELLLVLAGKKDANYERIESLVHRQAIKGVVFTDFISEGRLRWLYEHCSAYVFPSLSEGFGLPGLEAMAHGAPVVSSNATCLPEVYGDAAHYFDPLDTQAMADAINEVLTDKNLRDNLISKGRVQVTEYSWQRMAEQTLEVYKKALS